MNEMTDEFKAAFTLFLLGAQEIMRKHWEIQGYIHVPVPILTAEIGKRYVKVIRENSVHCFVDLTNGDVLKAASFKMPAKHARGNIFNDDHGVGAMSPYGANYLR